MSLDEVAKLVYALLTHLYFHDVSSGVTSFQDDVAKRLLKPLEVAE